MVKTSVSETPKLIASFQAALKREPLISKDESDWILDLITKSKTFRKRPRGIFTPLFKKINVDLKYTMVSIIENEIEEGSWPDECGLYLDVKEERFKLGPIVDRTSCCFPILYNNGLTKADGYFGYGDPDPCYCVESNFFNTFDDFLNDNTDDGVLSLTYSVRKKMVLDYSNLKDKFYSELLRFLESYLAGEFSSLIVTDPKVYCDKVFKDNRFQDESFFLRIFTDNGKYTKLPERLPIGFLFSEEFASYFGSEELPKILSLNLFDEYFIYSTEFDEFCRKYFWKLFELYKKDDLGLVVPLLINYYEMIISPPGKLGINYSDEFKEQTLKRIHTFLDGWLANAVRKKMNETIFYVIKKYTEELAEKLKYIYSLSKVEISLEELLSITTQRSYKDVQGQKLDQHLYVDFEETNRFFSGVKVIVDKDSETYHQKVYSEPIIFTMSIFNRKDFSDFLDILKSNKCKELLDLLIESGAKIVFQFTDYSEIILFPQSSERKLLEAKQLIDQYKGTVTFYGPLQDVINNLN